MVGGERRRPPKNPLPQYLPDIKATRVEVEHQQMAIRMCCEFDFRSPAVNGDAAEDTGLLGAITSPGAQHHQLLSCDA